MAEKKKKTRVCSVNQLRINKGRKIKLREQAGCALSLSLSKRYSTINYVSTAVTPLLSLPDSISHSQHSQHTHTDAGTHTNTSRVRDSGRHSYL